jgi:hypothetical protein
MQLRYLSAIFCTWNLIENTFLISSILQLKESKLISHIESTDINLVFTTNIFFIKNEFLHHEGMHLMLEGDEQRG